MIASLRRRTTSHLEPRAPGCSSPATLKAPGCSSQQIGIRAGLTDLEEEERKLSGLWRIWDQFHPLLYVVKTEALRHTDKPGIRR
ncbi:unnamed protein product [Lota lota]